MTIQAFRHSLTRLQLRACALTLVQSLTDCEAAKRMRTSSEAVYQLRYRARRRCPELRWRFPPRLGKRRVK